MSAKELLVKGKAVLEERGVNRDGWYVNTSTGCEVCSVGALLVAQGVEIFNAPQLLFLGDPALGTDTEEMVDYFTLNGTEAQWEAAGEAESYLMTALLVRVGVDSNINVRLYNDMSKSDQEVISLFDEAIALAS